MNRAQQALVGALAGALAVLSLHPATRPFLLRPLTAPPAAEGMGDYPTNQATRSYFLYHRVFGQGERSVDDWLSIAEAAQKMAETDKLNAVWPVLDAWAQDKIDNQEAAEAAWHRAAARSRWFDVSAVTVLPTDSAWDRYRQVSKLGAGWARAYSEYVARLDLVQPGEDAARWEAIDIGLVAWRGSTTAAGRVSISRALRSAMRFDATTKQPDADILKTAQKRLSPTGMADLMAATHSPVLGKAAQAQFAVQALAAQRLAGGAFLAGAAGVFVFVVGFAFASWGRARALLALPWCALIGVACGLAVFVSTNLVFPALWAVVVWGGFAFVRDQLWKGDLPSYGKVVPGLTALLGVSYVVAAACAVVTAEPGASAIQDATSFGVEVARAGYLFPALAWFLLSLVAITAQVFAFVRRRSPAVVGARLLRDFGLAVMVLGLVASVVLTPVCLAWDAKLRHAMEEGGMLEAR